MIRIKLRQLIDDKSFKEGKKITLDNINEATGLSKSTLSRMQSIQGYPATLETIDALCKYLDCQPGDLLEYVSDKKK